MPTQQLVSRMAGSWRSALNENFGAGSVAMNLFRAAANKSRSPGVRAAYRSAYRIWKRGLKRSNHLDAKAVRVANRLLSSSKKIRRR